MKRNFKFLSIFVIAITMVFVVTGCSKKVITAEQFKSKMEDKEYNVVDITDQYSSSDKFIKVYVALNEDKTYQIEYYQFKDVDSATNAFESSKTNFENSKGSSSVNTSVNLANYSKYSLSTNGKYKTITRVEDTLLYADVDSSYKNKVLDVFDSFGY